MIFFFVYLTKKDQANLNVYSKVLPSFYVLPTIYFNIALGNDLGLRMKVILVAPGMLTRQI